MEAERERLDTLTTYLERLNEEEPEAFDLGSWMASDSREELEKAMEEWPERYKKGEPLNCGTSACVAGHLPIVFPGDFAWSDIGHETTIGWVYRVEPDMPQFSLSGQGLADYFGGERSDWQRTIYPEYYTDVEPTLPNVLKRIIEIYEQNYGPRPKSRS